MPRDFYRNILILAVIISGLAFFAFNAPDSTANEIEKIKSLTNTQEQGVELKKLLERVGPIEAQEQMFRSGMPFTGETHLLIHVVGDYVYEKYGLDGLPYCRDYFLSACYHGFILNTLGDHGMKGLVDTMEKCNAAPPGVAPQCAHGTGHGFVAWHDYDLLKALKMCDELGGQVENFGFFNCYDGVFMENFWGVHNGAPSEKRWVKADDIYYPCNDPRIPEKYLRGCWANQATLAYQYLKGDIKKTADFCETVEKKEYKDMCYNNLYRQIHPITTGSKDKVFSLCMNVKEERRDDCLLANMAAYWSVGDRKVPYELCSAAKDKARENCFRDLVGMINFYYKDSAREKNMYCAKISDTNQRLTCEKS